MGLFVLMETFPYWLFIMDILFNFNTAYYKNGMIHNEKLDIINNYLKGNFILDLTIVIPYIFS